MTTCILQHNRPLPQGAMTRTHDYMHAGAQRAWLGPLLSEVVTESNENDGGLLEAKNACTGQRKHWMAGAYAFSHERHQQHPHTTCITAETWQLACAWPGRETSYMLHATSVHLHNVTTR